jgi:hypothetical protein
VNAAKISGFIGVYLKEGIADTAAFFYVHVGGVKGSLCNGEALFYLPKNT